MLTAPFDVRTDRTGRVIIAGHTFIQNLHRDHHELGLDAPPTPRVAAVFTPVAHAI
jgi:hypothetical protein